MDFTYLLTVIGTFISIYEISEDHKKRNFIFKFGSYDLILVALIFLLFIYFILVESYIEIKLEENKMYVVPQICGISCSFLIVISVLILIIAMSLYVIYKLNNGQIIMKGEFIKNLQSKFNEKKYDVIISDLWIFYDNFEQKSTHPTEEIKDDEKLLSDFLNTILRDKIFIAEMLDKNPFLGLKLLDNELVSDKKFVFSLYANYMVQNKNSLFYRELNENFEGEPHLLNFLFNDVKKCETLSAWQPIGERVIEYIRNQRLKEVDKENFIEGILEDKRWESPIYNGIVFFDQMISKALNQNYDHHMWLFYFDYFVKEILENILYNDEVDNEFKNMYEYYIYSMFSFCDDWIRYIETNDYSMEVDTTSIERRTNNIIKAAIITMTQSLSDIANSSKLRRGLKIYLRDIYLELYFDFAVSPQKLQSEYSTVIKNCLEDHLSNKKEKNNLWNLLDSAFNSFDRREGFDFIPVRHRENGSQKIKEFKLFLESYKPSKDLIE